jgi:hypothetical protein
MIILNGEMRNNEYNSRSIEKNISPPLDEFCEWCYNRVATKKQL